MRSLAIDTSTLVTTKIRFSESLGQILRLQKNKQVGFKEVCYPERISSLSRIKVFSSSFSKIGTKALKYRIIIITNVITKNMYFGNVIFRANRNIYLTNTVDIISKAL